jgi:hypothetical protein
MEEYGEIIYSEKNNIIRNKQKNKLKITNILLTTVALIVLISWLWFVYNLDTYPPEIYISAIFGAIMFPVLIFLFLIENKSLSEIEIYHNGLKLPVPTKIRNGIIFIPWDKIDTIYTNPKLPYLSVSIKGEKAIIIKKSHIGDISKCIENIPTEVNMVKDKNYVFMAGILKCIDR